MPNLSERSGDEFVKIILIGNSGSGKTGALVSLMPDYDLRILDMDNGIGTLANYAQAQCPDRLASVEFETYRDTYKAGPIGPTVDGAPRAFVRAMKALDKWPTDGSDPAEWGTGKVLVIDSLTQLGKAAYEWAKGQQPSVKDPRLWYGAAGEVLDSFVATITDESFRTNVIISSHIDWREDKQEVERGYVSAIGSALGRKLPRYVNTLVMMESKVQGKTQKRKLLTIPTATIDLKSAAPMRVSAEYPIETGLRDLFKDLKG